MNEPDTPGDDGRDWSDYESGPFCRHWSDPSDCIEPCALCQHACKSHPFGEECSEDKCPCVEFKSE